MLIGRRTEQNKGCEQYSRAVKTLFLETGKGKLTVETDERLWLQDDHGEFWSGEQRKEAVIGWEK